MLNGRMPVGRDFVISGKFDSDGERSSLIQRSLDDGNFGTRWQCGHIFPLQIFWCHHHMIRGPYHRDYEGAKRQRQHYHGKGQGSHGFSSQKGVLRLSTSRTNTLISHLLYWFYLPPGSLGSAAC